MPHKLIHPIAPPETLSAQPHRFELEGKSTFQISRGRQNNEAAGNLKRGECPTAYVDGAAMGHKRGRSRDCIHTHDNQDQADRESVRTAAEIDECGQWQLAHATNNSSDQIHQSREAMLMEATCDEGLPGAVGQLLERIDEADDSDSVERLVCDQWHVRACATHRVYAATIHFIVQTFMIALI
jgi:hypothetical protein